MKKGFDEIDKKLTKNLTKEKLICIGKNVRRLRKENNLTQMDVSFYMFCDKSTISNLERGCLNNITLYSIMRLTELFDIKIEDLIREI